MAYKRLEKIKSLISKGEKVLDVGTDHAILPIMLEKDGLVSKVVASEVAEGPFNIAKKNIKNAGLEDKIDLVMSDGLDSLSNRFFDTIVIAGMGGILISDIISRKKLKQRLILHPTNNHQTLRKQLKKIGYEIVEEYLVNEGKAQNIIIEARKNVFKSNMSKKEIEFGPSLMKKINEKEIKEYFINKKKHFDKIYIKSENKEFEKEIK